MRLKLKYYYLSRFSMSIKYFFNNTILESMQGDMNFSSISSLFYFFKRDFCKFTFVLMLSMVSLQGLAQRDSLLQAAKTETGAVKLETLKKLTYSTSNISEGVFYCRLLLAEAQKQNHIEYQSLALGKITNFYYFQFDSDSFLIAFEPYEQFCYAHQYYKHYFIVVCNYVDWHCQHEKYALAMTKANEAYELAKTLNDAKSTAMAIKNIASVYKAMDQFSDAIEYTNKGLIILKEMTPINHLSLINEYTSLGSYYSILKRPDMVVAYADTIMQTINEAMIYDNNVRFVESRIYAMALYSGAYSELGNYEKAHHFLKLGEQLLEESGLDYYQYVIDQAGCDYYKSVGNYEKALEYNKRFIDFLINNQMTMDLGNYLKEHAGFYEKLHQYEEAAHCYARVIELSDSLDKKQYANQINELRTIYELDKLELEAEKTQLMLKNSRLLASMLSALAIVLFAFVLFVLKNQKKLKAKNRLLYRQIIEQQKRGDSFGLPVVKDASQEQIFESEEAESQMNDLVFSLNTHMYNEKLYTKTDLSRKILADLLGTNETYLFEAIKQTYQLTFNEYLNFLRLDHACDLLTQPNSELTIEAVAIDSGFGSRNTFHRLFRERYQLTPIEFRQLARENVTKAFIIADG